MGRGRRVHTTPMIDDFMTYLTVYSVRSISICNFRRNVFAFQQTRSCPAIVCAAAFTYVHFILFESLRKVVLVLFDLFLFSPTLHYLQAVERVEKSITNSS